MKRTNGLAPVNRTAKAASPEWTPLYPIAWMFQLLGEWWFSLPPNEKERVKEAAGKVTSTNCWWAVYDAAGWVKDQNG